MPTDEPTPVFTKNDFVKRYEQGEFGNHSPTWPTFHDWLREKGKSRTALYHLRNRVKGGPTYYNLAIDEMIGTYMRVENEGDFYVSEMAPTERTTFQGEVYITEEGLSVHCSTLKKPMRDALRESPMNLKGLQAYAALQKFMNPLSWDWLNVLLNRYPEHVIEFSCYSTCWGTLPRYNTVFWEVRRY